METTVDVLCGYVYSVRMTRERRMPDPYYIFCVKLLRCPFY